MPASERIRKRGERKKERRGKRREGTRNCKRGARPSQNLAPNTTPERKTDIAAGKIRKKEEREKVKRRAASVASGDDTWLLVVRW